MRILTVAALAACLCAAAPDESAKEILDATGVKGGLVVHLGCGDGQLTAALRANDRYLVHGLDRSAENVAKARERLRSTGANGPVSVDVWKGDRLPYSDNVVNLLVAEDLDGTSMDEVRRALSPGGVAYVKTDGNWKKTTKPRPDNIDEWTHYLHDSTGNPVAHDTAIGPPRHLQWIGSPRWTRHHDRMTSVSAMVSAGGRLFTIVDMGSRVSIALPPRWTLIGRDAFSGTLLWQRPMGEWHTHLYPLKSGPASLPRRLVAVGDRVFATLGINAPLSAIDAATGKTILTFKESAATEELIHSNGVVFALVRSTPREGAAKEADQSNLNTVRARIKAMPWDGKPRRIMAYREETGAILWKHESVVVPLTLAADAKRVYFHDGERIVGLDRKSGKKLWRSEPVARLKAILSFFAPTLVVYEDVILFAGGEKMIPHRGGSDTMTAVSAETGKIMWNAPHPPSGYQSPEDILVTGGLVWTGAMTSGRHSGVFTGRDPKTGEVKKEFPPDVETYWFHHRCYRAKATDNFLLASRTGIEFVDFRKKSWEIHHWVRGGCLYGIMPCNGMIYTPPHPCACYPEAKLYGFNALAPASPTRKAPIDVPDEGRLERGPAFGKPVDETPAGEADWPTYRHDTTRTGFTKAAVPTELKQAWETMIGGKLTHPVVAGGRAYVSSVHTHVVHALDAASGEPQWTFTTGSRVDSPPTIWKGRVLFGSADGWIYCLRATDGALIWRFRAAPEARRMVAFEQVESVWPVPGNVLVRDGVAFAVAGRSMFLDGGIRFLRLDPATGKKLSETLLVEGKPGSDDHLQSKIQTLQMPVALPDVLSSDGKFVYMRSQQFDMEGKRLAIGPHSGSAAQQGSVQRGEGMHLFSPTGFTDDTWFHRAYWVYGRSFAGGHNGYYQAGKYAPAGRILVVDDENVYGFRRKPQYYKWTTPLEHHLFASGKVPPELPVQDRRGGGGKRKASSVQIQNTPSLNPTGKPLAVEAWVKAARPDGVILARGGSQVGYALHLRGGKPQFTVRLKKKVISVTAKTDVGKKWAHVAGVLTPDKKLKIYVDGELSATAEAGAFLASDPNDSMQIGADENSSVGNYAIPSSFTGMVDEVRVYHGAVSGEEIRKHASTPGDAAAAAAKLVLSLTFDKGDATDGSGQKNHGKLAGAQAAKGKVGQAIRLRPGKKGAAAPKSPLRTLAESYHWTEDLPMLVRAMVGSGKTLFIAGPRDLVDEDEVFKKYADEETRKLVAKQEAALLGREGAILWAVSATDGKKIAGINLDSPPVFDGMSAAGGKLYLSTMDGKVRCLEGAR